MGIKDTIKPKSDQKNADDLIAGPLTIKVTKVTVLVGAEQPVSVFFEGDDGKPYKPCLSMRRLLIEVWGDQEALYVGRSMTLIRDKSVTWAGAAVGGIRISHVSDITEDVTVSLTANKKQRKPYTVKVLEGVGPTKDPIDDLKKEFEKKAALISKEDAQRARDHVAKNPTAKDYAGVLKRIDSMIEEGKLNDSVEDESSKEPEITTPETQAPEHQQGNADLSDEESLFGG